MFFEKKETIVFYSFLFFVDHKFGEEKEAETNEMCSKMNEESMMTKIHKKDEKKMKNTPFPSVFDEINSLFITLKNFYITLINSI